MVEVGGDGEQCMRGVGRGGHGICVVKGRRGDTRKGVGRACTICRKIVAMVPKVRWARESQDSCHGPRPKARRVVAAQADSRAAPGQQRRSGRGDVADAASDAVGAVCR
eukprot:354037-Chlamydomonas_euryale.AAC.1